MAPRPRLLQLGVPAIFAAMLALCLAGCSTPRDISTASTAQPALAGTETNASGLQPLSYTRIANPDTNTVQLQIAIRKFVPDHHRGPAIWLAGTSHIGDPDYYRALQKHLDAQTIVLYEGVNAGTHKRHVAKKEEGISAAEKSPPPPGQKKAGVGEGPSMQATLAESLGLVFQLDAVDYDRTNFLNSDLSIQEIQRLMLDGGGTSPAAPGEKRVPNQSFDFLLQIMDGSSFLGSIMKLGMQFIGSSPELRAITKLVFIETIGQLKGDFADMRGLPPDLKRLVKVLIEARNQKVVDDLKVECKAVPRSGSISVFYGTGHMTDMERRLTRELHYRPAGEIWLTAFSVDLHRSGLSAGDLQMVRNLVKWEMDQMQQ